MRSLAMKPYYAISHLHNSYNLQNMRSSTNHLPLRTGLPLYLGTYGSASLTLIGYICITGGVASTVTYSDAGISFISTGRGSAFVSDVTS